MTPSPQATRDDPELVPRYTHRERLTHWAVALCYVALFLSGLALFHPFFYWLTGLFGGGALMRVIHPFLGAGFALLFFAYALPLWGENRLLPSDRAWLRGMLRYMNRTGEDLPVEGKFNAGQKTMYWSMLLVIAALLLTGLLMWRPFIAPFLSAPTKRVAGLVHAAMAFVMFVGIGIHAYAAFWTRGSLRAMTRGTVTRAWARFHHPGWYARVAGRGRP
jgi:formate dehydrogenase subunit gamma